MVKNEADNSKIKIDKLAGIIKKLHEGADVNEVKAEFSELVSDVSAYEIAQMEHQLINDGLPEEKIKKLCDVHVEIFKETLNEKKLPGVPDGHPVDNYMRENREAERVIQRFHYLVQSLGTSPDDAKVKEQAENFLSAIKKLEPIIIHYTRKENQLFPIIEAKGIQGPNEVMWAIHDDVRKGIKEVTEEFKRSPAVSTVEKLKTVVKAVNGMIYKEENILFPMALEQISPAEWYVMLLGEKEIGYAWITPEEWKPDISDDEIKKVMNSAKSAVKSSSYSAVSGTSIPSVDIHLDTGVLTAEQINMVFKNLPVEISFVDADDRVLYYSDTADRVFPRSPGVIGREVKKCHPPKSVHIVEKIVNSFKDGSKDSADFVIKMGERFIYIRYFAVRDDNKNYRGTLEVTQDITEIKKIENEKRILDWS